MKKLINLCVLGLIAFSTQAQNLNIVQRSRIPYPGTSNIWGYVDTVGNEYALVGANDRLSIVNVTNPSSPVKRFSVPGPNSQWREIRTWGKYAYVTTEGGGGLTIVDMRRLPDTVFYKQYTGDGAINNQLNAIHALHIDNGKLYLYGGGLQSGRAKMFSLADPWNPHYLGTVSSRYVHDGFAKNDTLYSCQIYDGLLEIIDARNPAAPVVIASQVTPMQFTHNSWMSTNGKVIYTTDEVSGSWVAAYDISNLQNIKELDRYKHNNSGSIGHNTYVLNNANVTGSNTDFLWTSYYTDGITLVDASRPDNLVEVGYFDSSPSFQGNGFHGAWGVYPYLPSGNVLISDIEMGMYVVTPTYKRASFLEGVVRDANTNIPIAGAIVKVIGKPLLDGTTNLQGAYKNGTVDTGNVVVEISSPGYVMKTVNVNLKNGVVASLDVMLGKKANFDLNKVVKDSAGQAVPNVDVLISNAEYTYKLKTNANGVLDIPVFYAGKYAIYVGKFGYKTLFIDSLIEYNSNNDFPELKLEKGYYDDFLFDNSWTVSSTATTGKWVKAKPIRTALNGVVVNPDFDVNNDYGDECYVTGNEVGNVTFDDIDNGIVTLVSPTMNFTTYQNPYINYSRWFTNLATSGSPNDTFTVILSNGTQKAIVEQLVGNTSDKGKWVAKSIRVKDFMPVTNNMKITVKASDLPGSDNITEAGLDKFFVSDSILSSVGDVNSNNIFINAFPNPSSGKVQLSYSFKNSNAGKITVFDVLGTKVFEKAVSDSYGLLNLNLEQKGFYIIKVESNSEQKVIKVLRQ